MNIVHISKDKLLKQLKENREDHKEIYELALKGWKHQVIEALNKALEKATADEEYQTYFDIREPESHLKDYDEIIARVEWHEDTLIQLDIREFNHFVRDCWDWMPDFLNQAAFYSNSSSSSSSSSGSLTLSRKMKSMF